MKNAPGQFFRKGISILELFKIFPDSETAENWFIERRWETNQFALIAGQKMSKAELSIRLCRFAVENCIVE